MDLVHDIQEIDYHRNGIAGEGFYAVSFRMKDGAKLRPMRAVLFEQEGCCAVLACDVDTVEFGVNSWRGDNFEPALRGAIKAKWPNPF